MVDHLSHLKSMKPSIALGQNGQIPTCELPLLRVEGALRFAYLGRVDSSFLKGARLF